MNPKFMGLCFVALISFGCVYGGRTTDGNAEGGTLKVDINTSGLPGGPGQSRPQGMIQGPCMHQIPCQHFGPFGPMHPYDTVHPFDWYPAG